MTQLSLIKFSAKLLTHIGLLTFEIYIVGYLPTENPRRLDRTTVRFLVRLKYDDHLGRETNRTYNVHDTAKTV